MIKHALITGALGASLAIGGCAAPHNGPQETPRQQEQTGAIIGGALGGLLGSQVGGGRGTTAAIIAGTLAGAAVGSNIGRTMDEVDRQRLAQTLERQPTGQSTEWRNPDSGADYTVTPERTFETEQRPCREFTVEAVIDGERDRVTGTACRTPNGEWQIQD